MPGSGMTVLAGLTSILATAWAGQVELDALGDPGADQFVIRVARLHRDAADVRDAAGRLEQHQAAFGAARLKRRPATSSVSAR